MAMHELEDFDQVLRKLLKGVPREKIMLALPTEMLRGFSDAYLDTFSEATRAAIRARIGR